MTFTVADSKTLDGGSITFVPDNPQLTLVSASLYTIAPSSPTSLTTSTTASNPIVM